MCYVVSLILLLDMFPALDHNGKSICNASGANTEIRSKDPTTACFCCHFNLRPLAACLSEQPVLTFRRWMISEKSDMTVVFTSFITQFVNIVDIDHSRNFSGKSKWVLSFAEFLSGFLIFSGCFGENQRKN